MILVECPCVFIPEETRCNWLKPALLSELVLCIHTDNRCSIHKMH